MPAGTRPSLRRSTDPVCREWLQQFWAEASAQLTLPADEVAGYRDALLERFGNPRIRHLLAQIAADGSQKMPVRVLPVVRAERAQGRLPLGALRVLAAWINHLRGAGAPVKDGNAELLVPLAQGPLDEAVPRVLAYLDADLAADSAVVVRDRRPVPQPRARVNRPPPRADHRRRAARRRHPRPRSQNGPDDPRMEADPRGGPTDPHRQREEGN